MKIFNDEARHTFKGKEYTGTELNAFMQEMEAKGDRFETEEERELFEFCWFMIK